MSALIESKLYIFYSHHLFILLLNIGYLALTIVDAEFPADLKINKQTVGFYFHVGKQLKDVLVINDKSRIRIPIRKGVPDEKLVVIAKSLGEDEKRLGSVSFILE